MLVYTTAKGEMLPIPTSQALSRGVKDQRRLKTSRESNPKMVYRFIFFLISSKNSSGITKINKTTCLLHGTIENCYVA